VPVTVKTRIGIDGRDSFEELCSFVGTVAGAGCRTFIVHARKALLNGLNPAQNRSVPPLRHEVVHALKQRFPDLCIVLNGGVNSPAEAARPLDRVDGVMIGRAAYADPALLAEADAVIFGAGPAPIAPMAVLAQYLCYCRAHHAAGAPWSVLARPALGIFHARPGARAWRQRLLEAAGDTAGLLHLAETTP
jgi:tRNA-dihydrouridine synthase A